MKLIIMLELPIIDDEIARKNLSRVEFIIYKLLLEKQKMEEEMKNKKGIVSQKLRYQT
jgi:hypothetical protein